MKFHSKLVALAAAVVLGTTFAAADTITLGSYATMNGAGGSAPSTLPDNTAVMYSKSNTYNIGSGASSTWAAAGPNSSWVSFDPQSGPTGNSVDPNGIYTYTSTFTTTGGNYNGYFSILADDTADVYLNGVKLISAGTIGGNSHCADGTPNCLTPATYYFSNYSLLSGVNLLTIDVYQTNLVYQGMDFYGSLTTTPEPGTLLMLGTGLLGSAGLLLRRKRA
ncbi:PEP-CTERM sorting domain-containing protein [Edaphobacter flagellatus]|uniref:PEP-CTERM sorting domain-containing protein n=1 Tax=Edaphobacter flagellatus TaxID=1933044 RepID=UPI0021B39610|nr:PEP-CTERM sorting domain-containing protein [Edaphobacter flagellatus]